MLPRRPLTLSPKRKGTRILPTTNEPGIVAAFLRQRRSILFGSSWSFRRGDFNNSSHQKVSSIIQFIGVGNVRVEELWGLFAIMIRFPHKQVINLRSNTHLIEGEKGPFRPWSWLRDCVELAWLRRTRIQYSSSCITRIHCSF